MRGTSTGWRAAAATDAGLLRTNNEDRSYVDEENGVCLVVDGLGGHAAGEKAAETAVRVIREQLEASRGEADSRVRRAITEANNTIYGLARERPEWRGMACVLTLAVVEGDRITIGHVGDSRLYLVWNGCMRKLTSDHSPVGEREDRGELSEEQAMRDPRRNEVFRDIGSSLHQADDEEFIEVRECQFKPDAALVLCSDGLSDLLTSAQMSRIIDGYDGDPAQVAADLVAAANDAGGSDNITALFVAGPEFQGKGNRHSITRMRPEKTEPARGIGRLLTGRVAFLLYGTALGMLIGAALVRHIR